MSPPEPRTRTTPRCRLKKIEFRRNRGAVPCILVALTGPAPPTPRIGSFALPSSAEPNQEPLRSLCVGGPFIIFESDGRRNHSTTLTFLSLLKSTLVESVLDPSA
jgi:hypothetical protein